MKTRRVGGIAALVAALLLAGCGGGSGGSGGVAVPSAVPAGSAAGGTRDSEAAAAPAAPASTSPSSPDARLASATQLIGSWLNDGSLKVDISPFKSRAAADAPPARRVLLPALTAGSSEVQKATPQGAGAPVQIGYARALADTAAASGVNALLAWQPSPRGGKVAALRFQSTGARGVRLGLLVQSLPLGGLVRFYADGSGEVYEVPAQEIQAAIQRNLDAGDSSDEARTYWSPDLGGEAITVEFEVPPGTPMDTVQVAVPRLSHVFADAGDMASLEKAAGASGSCNLDVSCASAYDATSKSVALMNFVRSGSSYVCTGTLLNDAASSGTPYFLSANHCISTQTVASSLWTYWFYRSNSCGSSTVSPAATWMKTGATLLYASDQTDTSFMRLLGTPPTGALYSASSPGGLATPAGVFGVHHPSGDLQKYSEGTASGAAGSCTTIDGSSCTPINSANFWKVNWNAGTTEGGSSGSGLFTRINGTPYLVGQLYGGYASCTTPAANDYYGRFDKAYSAALSRWLGASAQTPSTPSAGSRIPVYRLYNNKTQTHFYTASADERDRTVAQYAQYTYEGIGFYAQPAQAAGNTPVYRFFNTQTGAHFYTVSASERDRVRADLPQYSYEGVSWYVYPAAADQATAMYRFYNTDTATHFFTISSVESQNIQAKYPQYKYEGVAYYAWTSP
ncbi:MAG: hypothetical protein QM805_05225 [Pseudomonas sp.]